MTREEEIEKAVYDYSKQLEKRMNGIDYFNQENVEYAFIDGIEWADANPKSQWISVEDGLPCNHSELVRLQKSGYNMEVTEYVIAVINNFIFISRMQKEDGSWRWINDEPTYWMPIPKLPNGFLP